MSPDTQVAGRVDKSARLGYRHQKVQRLRKLFRRRSLRESENVFVVEGAKLLEDALLSGAQIESVFTTPDANHPILSRLHGVGVRIYNLEVGVMERVADAVSPQSMCAVVQKRTSNWAQIADSQTVVVLVNVRDPGNAGTILRSAEASGVGGVVFCDESVDVWSPKTVRSSAGSLFHVPVVVNVSSAEAVETLHEAGFMCIATAMDGSQQYDRADLKQKIALFFGNEANGLPELLLQSADQTLSIPIVGRSESLNVGMAASVLCFEVARQQRVAVEHR